MSKPTRAQLLEENERLKQQILEMQMQARNANSVLHKMVEQNRRLHAMLSKLQKATSDYLEIVRGGK